MRAARLALLVLLLVAPATAASAPREEGDGWAAVRRELAAVRALTPAERDGQRFLLVVDIDYTVTDPRRRTQRAAQAFGLGRVPLSKIGWDGAATARNLGLDAVTASRFQRFWLRFFFDPKNLRVDQPLPTAALLHEAKRAGAEIVYLTGRTDPLRAATIARLQRLGYPDATQVVTKPRIGVRTSAFKTRWFKTLPSTTKVLAYVTDSPGELRSLQRSGLRIPTIYVRSPDPAREGFRHRIPTIQLRRWR